MAISGTGSRAINTPRTFFVVLVLVFLLGFCGMITTIRPATASSDEVRWVPVNTPTEGEPGDWVLANGSDVRYLTAAADGAVYCYANPAGTSYTLFKSTDSGYHWSPAGQVTEMIVGIAVSADNARAIYFATEDSVYQSIDAGLSFTKLSGNPGGAGSDNIAITSIDVTRLNGSDIITASTRDSDDGQYGGIYLLDRNDPFTSWVDMQAGNYDVSTVTFSPDFVNSHRLVAVVTDETNTIITARTGNAGWGVTIGNATIAGITPRTAVIAFPDDYSADRQNSLFFVAIDSGNNTGDVYLLNSARAPNNSTATDLNIGSAESLGGVDVTALAISGNATTAFLLAGAAQSNQLYRSPDSGLSWSRSIKAPSGQSLTSVLMSANFTTSGVALAATSGLDSACSDTSDWGVTWNQRGLIDTTINNIVGLAVSPNYHQDSTLFLLTFDSIDTEHSLWRSLNGGGRWTRMLASSLIDTSNFSLVDFSPQYGNSRQTVFLSGADSAGPAIWKSTDNGRLFTRQSMPLPIDTWTAIDDDTLLLCSYNGSNGLLLQTNSHGLLQPSATVVGSYPVKSIAVSPDYENDASILIGDGNGGVYWSNDNGYSFSSLPAYATAPPLTGNILVAFDPGFSSNKAVYAASDTPTTSDSKQRIYRFTIGVSQNWKSIDGALPVGTILSQLALSPGGTLYATNSQTVSTTSQEGGMRRSLNPRSPLNATFETVTRGLNDGATLNGLWSIGNQLWSIDTINARIVTYTDSLVQPPALATPLSKAPGIGTSNVSLDWETLPGATEYRWQLNYDDNFSSIPSGFSGDTTSSSTRLPPLEMATTYRWRVRASEPVLSPWSATWSFTTYLGTTIYAPELYSPSAGTRGVLTNPVFQWSAIAGAENYELLVSSDISFSSPIIKRVGDNALPVTAWQSDVNLDGDTTYYWEVRGVGSGSYSAWSAVGAFTTVAIAPPTAPTTGPLASLPQSPSPPAAAETSPSPQSGLSSAAAQPAQSPLPLSLPDWATYLIVTLLIIVVLLLVTIIMVIARTKQSGSI